MVEADSRYLCKTAHCLEYSDEEIETVRVKAVGEEGYIKPPVVDSARRCAQEVERKKKAEAENADIQISDETKTKEQMAKDLAEKENFFRTGLDGEVWKTEGESDENSGFF